MIWLYLNNLTFLFRMKLNFYEARKIASWRDQAELKSSAETKLLNILSSHKQKIYESPKKQISSWDRIGRVEADNRKKAILGVSENKLWFILLFRSGFFHIENLTLIFTKEFGKMIYLFVIVSILDIFFLYTNNW